MKIIEDVIVSSEINNNLNFCCDIKKCKGACCVSGDAGAPLEPEEISCIQDGLEHIKQYMQKHAAMIIQHENVFDYDQDGNFVTALLDDTECIFTYFESGVAYCAIEKAFLQKKISFRKPLSCFLYPIRVTKEGAFRKLNYHKWDICQTAVEYGNRYTIRLIDFLKTPIEEKFGKEWYKLFHNSFKD